MAGTKRSHCRNGHPMLPANLIWKKSRGVEYRLCRMCEAKRDRLRYRNDPKRRASVMQRANAAYRAKKET